MVVRMPLDGEVATFCPHDTFPLTFEETAQELVSLPRPSYWFCTCFLFSPLGARV